MINKEAEAKIIAFVETYTERRFYTLAEIVKDFKTPRPNFTLWPGTLAQILIKAGYDYKVVDEKFGHATPEEVLFLLGK